eukprot:scaffold651_cov252-Pinguiococcus_pyrenoidosus.AAC.1
MMSSKPQGNYHPEACGRAPARAGGSLAELCSRLAAGLTWVAGRHAAHTNLRGGSRQRAMQVPDLGSMKVAAST